MNILGISAYYHDSAVCLVRDGDIAFAAQEERFTRKKHDHNFPIEAIRSCLKETGVEGTDLDLVAFYDKPFLKFERILETYLAYAPLGIRSFIKAIPLWIKKKLHMPHILAGSLCQISICQIKEIRFGQKYGSSLVVDLQKGLQIVERISLFKFLC